SSTSPGTWAVTGGANQQGNANLLLEKGEQFTISVHPSVGINPNERFFNRDQTSGRFCSCHRTHRTPDIKSVNPSPESTLKENHYLRNGFTTGFISWFSLTFRITGIPD
ncbi:MAG TPA: hypothetical protein VEI81_04960, partial [Methanoregula sp.]|nr:hypothetical protein [Methanoregula sp.]